MPNAQTEAAAPILITCDTAAGLVREAERRTGTEYVPFVDRDWVAGPAGRVDLFAAFSAHAGRPIDLREALFPVPGVPVPFALYFVPLDRAGPFTAFLDAVLVPLPDGRVVVPRHWRAASAAAFAPGVPPAVRDALAGCHLIVPQTIGPDDPFVVAMNRRLGGVPFAARPSSRPAAA